MSRKIARDLGIGVGISSGANFIGSVLLENEADGAVVTVFADDNKKYLSLRSCRGMLMRILNLYPIKYSL